MYFGFSICDDASNDRELSGLRAGYALAIPSARRMVVDWKSIVISSIDIVNNTLGHADRSGFVASSWPPGVISQLSL